jgi:hypothetical protein
VAMIFAREISGPLTSLVKKLDEATVKNRDAMMGSFVVFCSDDEGLEKKLQELAGKEKLQELILSIDGPSGPAKYKIAKDADVTVVLYNEHKVEANFALKKGELDDKKIAEIVKALPKILPKK